MRSADVLYSVLLYVGLIGWSCRSCMPWWVAWPCRFGLHGALIGSSCCFAGLTCRGGWHGHAGSGCMAPW